MHNQNGLVFDVKSGNALTQSLKAITEKSAAEWDQMSARSSQIIQGYSPAAWAEEVARVAGL